MKKAKPPDAQLSHRYVDMTADETLPARILRAYIDRSEVTDNTAGMPPSSVLIKEINRLRVKRNAIIEDAIRGLVPNPKLCEAEPCVNCNGKGHTLEHAGWTYGPGNDTAGRPAYAEKECPMCLGKGVK